MRGKSKKQVLIHIFLLIGMIVCYLIPAYADINPVITLSETKKNMVVGEKYKLAAVIADHEQREVTWKSSNPKIASVNKKGVVKAKKNGNVKIIATIKGTRYKAECRIKITKAQNDFLHYSEAGIEFDYPSGLKLKERSGEDGSRKEFLNRGGSLVFWYEQGEKWRVDLEQDQHAYKEQLGEKYKDVQIDEYTVENRNGIKMLKIVFHFMNENKNQKMAEYLMVSEYAFFDFYFINPEDDFVDKLIKSIHFVNL